MSNPGTTPIPDFVPVLSAGAHENPEDGACVMEMVSYLAGEKWSDRPACTHPVLGRAAMAVNDLLSDGDRHQLIPLMGRLFDTAEPADRDTRERLHYQLTTWVARQGLPYVDAKTAQVCREAIDMHETAAAWDTWGAWKPMGYVAAHMPYPGTPALTVNYWAMMAAAYAHQLTAVDSTALVLKCTGRPGILVGLLSDLLDHYDQLTGRTSHREVSSEELGELAQLTGAQQ